jgi:hypothetical protein
MRFPLGEFNLLRTKHPWQIKPNRGKSIDRGAPMGKEIKRSGTALKLLFDLISNCVDSKGQRCVWFSDKVGSDGANTNAKTCCVG